MYYRVWHLPYSEDPQELFGFWWGDLLVKGDNHIGVTTEENKDGYTVDLDIKHFESLPELAEPGYEYKTTWHKAGLNSRSYREEYPTAFPGNKWRHNMNTRFLAQEANRHWEFPPQPVVTQFTPVIFAVNECFTFPELPAGMAAFNGINAYIKLDNPLGAINQDFVIDLDVRLNQTVNHWPVFGVQGTGGFIGMQGADLIIGAAQRTTSWTPVTDVWFNWRLEFEQQSQLNYELFIDDVKVLDTVTNRLNFQPNTIGVYKQGVSGTLWADADFKNLKVKNGDAPSSNVLLDMPLLENALDIGPLLNHGTTFHMPLPSV
jgi:hypothetical protein